MASVGKLITINGTSNVGKTTVSDLLTLMRPKTVPIELDSRCIGRITRRLSEETKAYLSSWEKEHGNTIYEDSATLAVNWVDRGCDVILPGIFPMNGFKEFRRHVEKRLGARRVVYYCFHLKPPMEIALQTRGPRILNDTERKHITDTYGWIYKYEYGVVIDNQDQTPEQTAEWILRYIEDGEPEASSWE